MFSDGLISEFRDLPRVLDFRITHLSSDFTQSIFDCFEAALEHSFSILHYTNASSALINLGQCN